MNEEWRAWLHHQKLVKTTSSSSIPKLSRAQQGGASVPSAQLGAHHPERSLKQWPPIPTAYRLPASCLFSNIHRFKC